MPISRWNEAHNPHIRRKNFCPNRAAVAGVIVEGLKP